MLMSTESLINCEHVSCTYGNAAVLDDVYMQVNRGEFVGVVGPSGSGKTTLLKAILGTHPVAHGSITMQPKLTLGYVPQVETVDWYFPVTVEEVIVMTRSKSTWWPRITQAERKAVRDVLDRLGIGEVANRHIRELSGGQQQRLVIARAIAIEPEVLLLDEPASALDPISTLKIEELIYELKDKYTIVIVTHNMQQAARVSDFTAYMYLGELVEFGATEQIFFKH